MLYRDDKKVDCVSDMTTIHHCGRRREEGGIRKKYWSNNWYLSLFSAIGYSYIS